MSEESNNALQELSAEEARIIAESFEPTRARHRLVWILSSALIVALVVGFVGYEAWFGVGAMSAAFAGFIIFVGIEKALLLQRRLAIRELIQKLTFRIEQDEHRSLRAEARKKAWDASRAA
jgi:hypothetical protein